MIGPSTLPLVLELVVRREDGEDVEIVAWIEEELDVVVDEEVVVATVPA